MVADGISPPPRLSSRRTKPDTMRSIPSVSTGRLRSATSSERTSLSRSNGMRMPLRLTTISSRSCTRSKVVKRWPQAVHTRRRRKAALSSLGRESFTWVSRLPQNGQRIPLAPSAVNRKARHEPLHLLAHRRLGVRIRFTLVLRKHVEHLGDAVAHFLEFLYAKATGRAGRRAEADAGGDRRRLWIERDAVLVGGDLRSSE